MNTDPNYNNPFYLTDSGRVMCFAFEGTRKAQSLDKVLSQLMDSLGLDMVDLVVEFQGRTEAILITPANLRDVPQWQLTDAFSAIRRYLCGESVSFTEHPDVEGALIADGSPFNIPHETDEGKPLVHGQYARPNRQGGKGGRGGGWSANYAIWINCEHFDGQMDGVEYEDNQGRGGRSNSGRSNGPSMEQELASSPRST